ncbi:delta(1)-pyrroline-2-carboxylate reductase family protein [Achromobacter sp. Marseille-Q0513]|uniref:bifunctional Delta(1)-pyrroline-2-carboxylate/Delta(1)-piperideine-2- carboxylate reductase n=1 Tax=Achromobacter sp. Marseille-Q0513 TaxID=2829161 RepID=UPI001B991F0C|nr:bifunctional Delta(1)-pyrroline-2-carboxylate/Delta(1)-piperideine-2-carboxylate reductase [Achromobacter sp. Marseille-Q0513]MBR8655457.1 delta(1)-pyrroline-2-carboxylate reductase family protein [Achromobacter sp. Marseille-Q0513]
MSTHACALAEPAAAVQFAICDRARTASLLDFHALVDALATAVLELEAGLIVSPERLMVPLGEGGVLLSMPAAAADIGIHKLANVQPANAAAGLPTIHGAVTVCDAATGRPLCLLDGPEVTGRRTAALSLLAIRALSGKAPESALLVGTGEQARHHLHALRALHPGCRIRVRGLDAAASAAFCEAQGLDQAASCAGKVPGDVDVVITLTTSAMPVYDEPAVPGRLVIGVGAFKPEMAELGKTTLDGSDVYADDLPGARLEAGDLLRAGVDWGRVRPLAAALRVAPDRTRPAVFKSVGTAAWDLAAARLAVRALKAGR